jgi:hypothetical protein
MVVYIARVLAADNTPFCSLILSQRAFIVGSSHRWLPVADLHTSPVIIIDIQQNGYTTKFVESISKNKNEELRKPFKENPKASLDEIPASCCCDVIDESHLNTKEDMSINARIPCIWTLLLPWFKLRREQLREQQCLLMEGLFTVSVHEEIIDLAVFVRMCWLAGG